MTLGNKIYKQRKKIGLSQEELADKVGVTRQAVSKWETDSMQPTFDNVKLLSTVLEVNIGYFVNSQTANNEGVKEIAISVNPEIVDNKDVLKKKQVGYIIGISLSSFLFVIVTLITIIIGMIVFTTNTGDYEVIISSNLNKTYFYVCLIIAIIMFVSDAVFVILLLRNKLKCNVKLTKCK